MRRANAIILALGSALLVLPTGGCFLAASALSPGLLGSLGLDPAVIYAPRGTVIVVFQNNTDSVVLFNAFETSDPTDLTVNTRNFSVSVDPGASRNEVLECPIGAISPGTVTGEGDALMVDVANAAIVFADAAGAAVAYNGSAVVAGQGFACGDVISVTLTPVGAAFQLTVQVLPGR